MQNSENKKHKQKGEVNKEDNEQQQAWRNLKLHKWGMSIPDKAKDW